MAALIFATCAQASRAEVTVRDPGTFVVDKAQLCDDQTRERLEGWLRELEQKSGAQVKVLTVVSIEEEDFFGFTQRHFDLWQLGEKGKDNGALIALARKERKVRIHTGYGLEGVLPDAWCGSISRDMARRFFKEGQYSQGLYEMTVATAGRVADDAGVQLTGMPAVRYAPPQGGTVRGLICVAIFMVFLIMLAASRRRFSRRRYHRRWGGGLGEAIFWGTMLSGHRGRSGWGGSSGGIGGGFGGFGGGSFGGGGMSGGGGGGASW